MSTLFDDYCYALRNEPQVEVDCVYCGEYAAIDRWDWESPSLYQCDRPECLNEDDEDE